MIAPSIALIMRIARARRSEVPFGGTMPVEYAKLRLSRAVYTAFAEPGQIVRMHVGEHHADPIADTN